MYENVERFWLGGALHVRGGGTDEVAAPVSQKRVGLKRRPERAVDWDCCGRQPIDERRCWAVRVVGAGGLSVVTWYAAAFAADRLARLIQR